MNVYFIEKQHYLQRIYKVLRKYTKISPRKTSLLQKRCVIHDVEKKLHYECSALPSIIELASIVCNRL